MRIRSVALLPFAFALALTLSLASVPPDIATQLREMGRVVNPAGTAKLYRPMQPKAPYPGVKVERDIKYGPDARTVLDVFAPEKGRGSRPVLIYVAGGAGNKIEPVPDGDAFYDNIMLWAVKNGMTGVNVQRRGGQGLEWDETAKDIGKVIEWVQQNISKYKGNPDRVFIWAHSAGNGPVGTYIGHPELYGPKGIGLKGAILMSGNFNILPVTVPVAAGQEGRGAPKGGPNGKGGGKGRGGLQSIQPCNYSVPTCPASRRPRSVFSWRQPSWIRPIWLPSRTRSRNNCAKPAIARSSWCSKITATCRKCSRRTPPTIRSAVPS
jgi:hypothetical protein